MIHAKLEWTLNGASADGPVIVNSIPSGATDKHTIEIEIDTSEVGQDTFSITATNADDNNDTETSDPVSTVNVVNLEIEIDGRTSDDDWVCLSPNNQTNFSLPETSDRALLGITLEGGSDVHKNVQLREVAPPGALNPGAIDFVNTTTNFDISGGESISVPIVGSEYSMNKDDVIIEGVVNGLVRAKERLTVPAVALTIRVGSGDGPQELSPNNDAREFIENRVGGDNIGLISDPNSGARYLVELVGDVLPTDFSFDSANIDIKRRIRVKFWVDQSPGDDNPPSLVTSDGIGQAGGAADDSNNADEDLMPGESGQIFSADAPGIPTDTEVPFGVAGKMLRAGDKARFRANFVEYVTVNGNLCSNILPWFVRSGICIEDTSDGTAPFTFAQSPESDNEAGRGATSLDSGLE